MITSNIRHAIIEAVRQVAAEHIMPRFRQLSDDEIDTKSGPDDLVTVADLASEKALTEAFATILPSALVIGEEAVAADNSLLDQLHDAPLSVIIDPIDGTSNYAAGLALFGVILAVVKDGQTVFGLLYDPVMDDWVYAHASSGAWFEAPQTSTRPHRRQRLIAQTTPPVGSIGGYVPFNLYPADQRAAMMERFTTLGKPRTLRCSCHEYRTIAMGHANYCVSPNPKPWDHAAGSLIVSEVGGASLADTTLGYRPSQPVNRLVVGSSREVVNLVSNA